MERLTRAKAIRLKCLDCCCSQTVEARECRIKTCSLWRFRMGKEERDQLYHEAFVPKEKASML